jgi:hypothetical protein
MSATSSRRPDFSCVLIAEPNASRALILRWLNPDSLILVSRCVNCHSTCVITRNLMRCAAYGSKSEIIENFHTNCLE